MLSLTICLRFIPCQHRAVGPEANVDVVITLTEIRDRRLYLQQCDTTCKAHMVLTEVHRP